MPVFASGVVNPLFKPFGFLRDGIYGGTSRTLSYFSSKSDLHDENEKLKKEIESLNLRILNLRLTAEENESLRGLVSLTEPHGTYKTLRVISKPPFTPYDYLVLHGGENQGIVVGQKVYANDALILGEIVEVYSGTSKARLYSSYGDETEIKMEGSGAFLKAKGRGMGNFRIEAPREIVVEKGQLITFPEDGGDIVAQIYSVSAGATDPFQLVLARYPVNILELIFVRVK